MTMPSKEAFGIRKVERLGAEEASISPVS